LVNPKGIPFSGETAKCNDSAFIADVRYLWLRNRSDSRIALFFRREILMADTFQLTSDQQTAFEQICASIISGENHVLMGYAGTGKSYLCKKLATAFPSSRFITPTNKAAKVLSCDMGVPASTVHKMLALRPEKGELKQFGVGDWPDGGVVFVDECSMVDSTLYGFLTEQKPDNVSLVFIGDPFQLPPIKEKESLTFATANKSTLRQIVRQAADNPLIAYSMQIREKGFSANTIPFGGPIRAFPKGVTETNALQLLVHNAQTGGVYAAWRNVVVDGVNQAIHHAIYGKGSEIFVKGEMLVLGSPLISRLSRQTIGDVGDEFKVIGVRRAEYKDIPAMEIEVEGVGERIIAVHPEGKAKYEAKRQELADRKQWGMFYGLQEFFTQVSHTYAFTCHKLQGSTYDRVIVNAADIVRNPNIAERDRCAYVAVTRTRNQAIFI